MDKAKILSAIIDEQEKVINNLKASIERYKQESNMDEDNTLDPDDYARQNEAKELARESDLIIVVGSKKSANTTHLAEILSGITKTIHIENDMELDNYQNIIDNSTNIAITAGASTPDVIIEKVIEKLKGE